nr:MAG TPA: hypothetical protein [Caudoviricetes sp.]
MKLLAFSGRTDCSKPHNWDGIVIVSYIGVCSFFFVILIVR